MVAWVQGRWEIGPRALGNRSLLAEPFRAETRDRLNAIKLREGYRPIAPCAGSRTSTPRSTAASRIRTCCISGGSLGRLQAVTHVDGSARVQTVGAGTNARLHELLTAFAAGHGVGVLCNTSLNFNGHGFINRLSDLTRYCENRGVDDMVVGDAWYRNRIAAR